MKAENAIERNLTIRAQRILNHQEDDEKLHPKVEQAL